MKEMEGQSGVYPGQSRQVKDRHKGDMQITTSCGLIAPPIMIRMSPSDYAEDYDSMMGARRSTGSSLLRLQLHTFNKIIGNKFLGASRRNPNKTETQSPSLEC